MKIYKILQFLLYSAVWVPDLTRTQTNSWETNHRLKTYEIMQVLLGFAHLSCRHQTTSRRLKFLKTVHFMQVLLGFAHLSCRHQPNSRKLKFLKTVHFMQVLLGFAHLSCRHQPNSRVCRTGRGQLEASATGERHCLLETGIISQPTRARTVF